MAPVHRGRQHFYRETDRKRAKDDKVARHEERKSLNQKPKITIDEFSRMVDEAVSNKVPRQKAIEILNLKYDIL